MKSKHCEWCDNQFETKISYQIYCSIECREEATKEKIAKRYQALSLKNRSKKKRFCKSCGALLSIYNDDQNCQSCEIVQSDVMKALKDIKGLGNGKD